MVTPWGFKTNFIEKFSNFPTMSSVLDCKMSRWQYLKIFLEETLLGVASRLLEPNFKYFDTFNGHLKAYRTVPSKSNA